MTSARKNETLYSGQHKLLERRGIKKPAISLSSHGTKYVYISTMLTFPFSVGYENTTIRLASPDYNFPKTLQTLGAEATPLQSKDGGMTWTVNLINILDGRFPKVD
jgi:hypothetical protein